MKLQADENLELRRYLLRELNEAETQKISARLFLETEYLEQLKAVEDDLIDDYVYEALSADERKRFETKFLSEPERYEDLKIAMALKHYVSTQPDSPPLVEETEELDVITPPSPSYSFWTSISSRPRAFKLLLAAAVFVVVIGGMWLILRAVRRQEQSLPLQAQQPTPEKDKGNSNLPQGENIVNRGEVNKNQQEEGMDQQVTHNSQRPLPNTPQRASTGNDRPSNREGVKRPISQQTNIIAFLIPVGSVRDVGNVKKKVTISEGASIVNFQLALINKDDGWNYQATLQTVDGRSIKTWTDLHSTGSKSRPIISIKAPVNLFDEQDYSFALKAVTPAGNVRDINNYPFQILKPPARVNPPQ